MEASLRDVLGKIYLKELTCSAAERSGCVDSNIKHIARGDLYVDANVYNEGGGAPGCITSTSQLKGFHSGIKKVLARDVRAELGLLILDVHIFQHNLTVGARYGRNSELGRVDLIAACRSAVLCSQSTAGLLATSADQEFVNQIMPNPFRPPQFRSATQLDFSFKMWQTIFQSARVQTEAFEVNLARSRQHFTTIKKLLLKNTTALQTGTVHRRVFMHSLRLGDAECEGAVGFSAREYELLRQLRQEQKLTGRSWTESVLVTTVMHNLVVATNINSQLKLRHRSIRTVGTALKTTQLQAHTGSSKTTSHSSVFQFRVQKEVSNADQLSMSEQSLQIDLFTTIRQANYISKPERIQVFCMLLDFASCVCDGIRSFTDKDMRVRWEAIKKASSAGKSLKIKIKLLPRVENNTPRPQLNPLQSHQTPPVANSNPPDTATTSCTRNSTTGPTRESANQPTAGLLREPSDAAEALASQHLSITPSNCTPPIRIAEHHLEELRHLSNSLRGVRGKWPHILSVFNSYYPGVEMNENTLRMRLRSTNSYSKTAQPRTHVLWKCSSYRSAKRRRVDLARSDARSAERVQTA